MQRKFFTFFSQQRKLLGSSAQISSGVCRCRSQEQVPEQGSGRFRKVPEGSRKFRSVGGGGRCKGSGRSGEVPEGPRGFRRVGGHAQVLHRVLPAYEQNNAPMCKFEIEKTNAHDTAMYALQLLGIPPKLIFLSGEGLCKKTFT